MKTKSLNREQLEDLRTTIIQRKIDLINSIKSFQEQLKVYDDLFLAITMLTERIDNND
jgi:hypothetical protein